MRGLLVALLLSAAYAVTPSVVFAESWPRLSNGITDSRCTEALRIAKATFESDVFYLYTPPAIRTAEASIVVLEPAQTDISGGDELRVDEALFSKLTPATGSGRIYWQKNASHGIRVVVEQTPFNWQGDTYALFALKPHVSPQEFMRDQSNPRREFMSVISGWRPPLVLHDTRSGEIWGVDVGEPYDWLADWRVYAPAAGRLELRCSVLFRPKIKSPVDMLPEPVRKLERVLDQSIGSGRDEGTLQPTARLKLYVRHAWANAALRPWALHDAYNSRAEVNRSLYAWSRKGPRHAEAYRQIQKYYSLAERAVATYYQKRFDRSADEAKLLAAFVLDVVFRSHYSFHAERDFSAEPQPNPFRQRLVSHKVPAALGPPKPPSALELLADRAGGVDKMWDSAIANNDRRGLEILFQHASAIQYWGDGLVAAVTQRKDDLLKRMLRAGADPNVRPNFKTPLQIAVCAGTPGAVEILLKFGARNALDDYGEDALTEAIHCGAFDAIDMLLTHGARLDGRWIVNLASHTDDARLSRAFEKLLDRGLNPNATIGALPAGGKEDNPLRFGFADYSLLQFARALKKDRLAEVLLRAGARP